MLQAGSTIIIPMRGQLHLLLQAIRGLRRYSDVSHRILVVYSSAPVSDWAVRDDGQAYRYLETMADVQRCLNKCGLGHGVDCYDVTSECEDVPAWPPIDGARKSNYGLRYVDTPWVCPAWDADYYPLLGWDRYFVEAMEATGGQGVYVPRFLECVARTVCVPPPMPQYPAVFPGWNGYLTYAGVEDIAKNAIAQEPGRVLTATGWADTSVAINPQWWRTDVLGGAVPIPETGKTPEWELSKKAEGVGLRRVAHSRSFILHKYSIADEVGTWGAA